MKERQDKEDYVEVAEKFWYLSRIQRAARKLLKENRNFRDTPEEKFATTLHRIRMENPLFWILISTDAQRLRITDMGRKAEQLREEDPSFTTRAQEERIKMTEEALIKEYWELSKKAPRGLRILEGLLFSE